MSYEDLITRQLDRIAVDIGDPTKTVLNILVLEAFTTIDRYNDGKYEKDLANIEVIWKLRKKNAYDIVTKKDDSNAVLKLEYTKAIATIEPIMRCLKRAGRFPAKFGYLDEASGEEQEIKERETSGSIQDVSGDGVAPDQTQ